LKVSEVGLNDLVELNEGWSFFRVISDHLFNGVEEEVGVSAFDFVKEVFNLLVVNDAFLEVVANGWYGKGGHV
jgi:hypothetical protein